MYFYTYPITRHGELETKVARETFTDKKKDVMAFYQQEISDEDRERILIGYEDGTVADIFGYIKDNLIDRDEEDEPCKYWELMGDCRFYEGLENLGDGCFSVLLGS